MAVDTLPKLLVGNYKKYGDKKIALRRKDLGIWNEYTWKDYYEHVKYFGLGLLSLGFKPGDKLAIIGDNDPEWYWAEIGAQAVGGIPFGIYVDCMPSEIKYYLEHSEARFIVARDEEQVDKLLSLTEEIPDIKKIVYWDPKGLWKTQEPLLASFEEVEEAGREYEKGNSGLFEELVEKGKGEDIAIFCYTSGTTGLPKGAMINHNALISAAGSMAAINKIEEFEDYLSYICPAWAAEQLIGISIGLLKAMMVNFPEEPETVQHDIREIGPKRVFYGARLWEDVASLIQVKIAEGVAIKRFFYNLALKVSYAFAQAKEEKKEPKLTMLRFINLLMRFMVFRPLRDKVGLLNIKTGFTAGAAIAPETMELFHSFGVNLKNMYGSSEFLILSMHRDGDIRCETVGKVLDGCEAKISEEGEILAKGPVTFTGYFKDPEKTAKKFKDGWFCSGDAGYIDKEGHLVYWDRVEDLIGLPDGTKFAPQFIEIRLRFSPYIRDVMVVGGEDKPFVSALVNTDYGNVWKWAERERIPYTTYVDLSQRPEVRELILKEVQRVNRVLPDSAKIKRFVSMHKEFDPDEAELTRTRKLKRELLEGRYQQLIDAMCQDEEVIVLKAPVTYRDGRKGIVESKVFVNEVPLEE